MKKKIAIALIAIVSIGLVITYSGFFSEDSSPKNIDEGEAKLFMSEDVDFGNSTEIRGVYVVQSVDVSEAMQDNLEADPNNLVVASFTSSGGTAQVDWGTTYELIAYCYGEENEVSNDPANIRLGWDGKYWGDDSGSVTMPDENSAEEYMFTGGEDGFNPASNTFTVDGDTHIALNYRGNSGGFSLSRDETATIDEILLQAYF